jgi:hypothetical protein
LRPAEQSDIDLEPGREHQQQFAQLGEEVRDRPVLAKKAEHVWPQNNLEEQQPDHRRHSDACRQPWNANNGRDDDGELCQIRQRQDVRPDRIEQVHRIVPLGVMPVSDQAGFATTW